MGIQFLYINGPQLLLRVGSRAASGKISIDVALNRLNYCVLVTVFNLDLILRQELIKDYILGIALYGAETWNVVHTVKRKKDNLISQI